MRVPTAAKLLGLIAGLAALLAGYVAAVGGFEPRQAFVERQPGEVLQLGPVDIRPLNARHYEFEQYVEVHTTCQLALDSSSLGLRGRLTDAVIAYHRPDGQENVISQNTVLSLGQTATAYEKDRADLAPGVPPVPCIFRFEMPDEPRPRTIRVILPQFEFADPSIVSNDADVSKTWQPATSGYWVELPVEWASRDT
ncbi:MAG: hypothetical protein ACOX61_01820 [Brooklawnia sp.]|jgi:hypothetical protein